MARRLAYLVAAVTAVLTAVLFAAPPKAEAAGCGVLLLFDCPAPPPPPPPAPLPPPPTPTPTPFPGPPTAPPAGNPRCRPLPQPTSSVFVGVGEGGLSTNPRDRQCTLARMAASGVRIVRALFNWSSLEPAAGHYDFAFYDAYVEQLARYRMRVLPIVFGSPRFYSSSPAARYPERAQPRRNRELGRFARALARRYGPRGSFWRAHPRLPRIPIRSWQVWNEPNLSFFWRPRPSPRQYVRMLRVASKAIKGVDRRAEIVVGGLPESQFGTPVSRYVSGIYRAGGSRWFDTMAIHIYSRTVRGAILGVDRLRRLMNRHGDTRARIWVTEFGWPSGGPRHRFRVGPRRHAANVRQALRTLWRRRAALRIRGAIYVAWRDLPRYRSDFWGLHIGLYRRDGKPKPAARSFARTVRSLR